MNAPLGMNVQQDPNPPSDNWFVNTYNRRIKPFDKWDYIMHGAVLALSVTVTLVANHYFVAWLPFATGLSAFALLIVWKISSNRIDKIFDAKAWEIVNRIRTAAKGLNGNHPAFAPIDQAVGELEKPEFSHQEEQIKQLKSQLAHFKKTKDNFANDKDSFVVQLKTLQDRLIPGKPIVDPPVI